MTLQEWEQRFDDLLADYRHRIGYGNLRAQRTEWNNCSPIINFALVYELPGGSSSQINVEYHTADQSFRYLDADTAEECATCDPQAVLEMLRTSISRIPARREQSLRQDIDRWFGEGKSSHEMFLEINKLLQTDFKGGSLTSQELKAGIHYVMQIGKAQTSE